MSNEDLSTRLLRCKGRIRFSIAVSVVCLVVAQSELRALDPLVEAQRYGAQRTALRVQPDGLYVCEAEEFRVRDAAGNGWSAKRFGENYYAATFANTFLSRKAFLAAPEQCERTVAELPVHIEQAGRYLVLVRYEAAYRFETQFRVEILQDNRVVFTRLYGARDHVKIWPFGEKLKTEVCWSWGATENIVWEGHEAYVELRPGLAVIRLIAEVQPEPAARRHVDLVMLTSDETQVKQRLDSESYLPLDGMLTQSGDVFMRVTNLSDAPMVFTGRGAPGGGNWQQHSPYWVHLRRWTVPRIELASGQTSEWIEVGSTMDTLADGQWFWTGNGRYRVEFAVRGPNGQLEPLATFAGEDDLTLAADADTRYSRRLRRQEEVLFELLDYLKRENPAPHGRVPQRTPIYATTFEPLDQGRHAAAVAEFKAMFGITDPVPDAPHRRGYIDVRGVPTAQLAEFCEKLGSKRDNIAVVSLGDEISLPEPPRTDVDQAFRQWLQSQGVSIESIARLKNANETLYNPSETAKKANPGIYYWSKRYQYHFGISAIKERTDILRRYLPQAAVGANYSPHYPVDHLYLGEVFKWVSVFRESGMTLPWSEDYIWQVPVGTPQMHEINLDLFRSANRHHMDRKIMYYVMPHAPNNTPSQWRRLFYSALGHGMKIVNLFEFRPVYVAYTENHVDDPRMYQMVLRSFRELGLFEDIIQDGHMLPAQAALWFSETGDIWSDNVGSFAPAKRALYTAVQHRQIPLDIVVEADAIDGTLAKYKLLYLTDRHVSAAASARIAQWVEQGGRLFVTAGGGSLDELDRPNEKLRQLMGVEVTDSEAPADSQVTWIKQDLPFARPIDTVAGVDEQAASPTNGTPAKTSLFSVFGVRTRFRPAADCRVVYRFSDGSPAVVQRKVGEGQVVYCGFLPGLSYFYPAIPKRPVDRGATDNAMAHLLPTDFDKNVAKLAELLADCIQRPITCSEELVESCVIQSPHGTAIVLINWKGKPIHDLQVTVSLPGLPKQAFLASGTPLAVEETGNARVFRCNLDVADTIVVR